MSSDRHTIIVSDVEATGTCRPWDYDTGTTPRRLTGRPSQARLS